MGISTNFYYRSLQLTGILLLWISIIVSVSAKVEAVEFEDKAKQALYQQLIKELRCLVCQNQNLADSNADLAVDLRRKTRELVAAGKARQDVIDYMVSRYGEFVLYRPAFNRSNLFLWLSPVVLLLLAAWLAISGRNRKKSDPGEFSAQQRSQVKKMLGNNDKSAPRER